MNTEQVHYRLERNLKYHRCVSTDGRREYQMIERMSKRKLEESWKPKSTYIKKKQLEFWGHIMKKNDLEKLILKEHTDC